MNDSSAATFSALERLQARQISGLEAALLNAEAEVARLREALERVYQVGRGPHVEIARQALNA